MTRLPHSALGLLVAGLGAANAAAAMGPTDCPPQWALNTTYNASNFFDGFNFYESTASAVDPTHGFVWYRNRADAEAMGLAKIVDDKVYLGVDSFSRAVPNATFGRSSVRLESKAQYRHGLFIYDLARLPRRACGTWPAIWMYGSNWPYNGEVDIYENWNDNFPFNRQTLHTGGNGTGCTVRGTTQTGRQATFDCNTFAKNQSYGQGCSAHDYGAGAYGDANGGFYAMQWTSAGIQMWHFPPGRAPADMRDATATPDPSRWGTPSYTSTGGTGACDVDASFGPQWLVFNLDFCGDTAANETQWNQTSCYADGWRTCQDYVAARPGAFKDYYFSVREVRVYDWLGNETSQAGHGKGNGTEPEGAVASRARGVGMARRDLKWW